MQEKSLIKKNILEYLEIKGLTKYKFYQQTGITRGVLDQNNGMSEENTARIIAYFKDINPIWLLTGQGEMILSNSYPIPKESIPDIVAERPFQAYESDKDEVIKQLKERLIDKEEVIILLRSEVKRLKSLLDIDSGGQTKSA
jgi:hypothetical protein